MPAKLKPGLTAEYHAGIHLSDLQKTGVDANLYFDWAGPAWTGGPADEFSIRWSGAFRAPRKGRYLVEVQSDDGAKLFLGGRELISNWTLHPPVTDAALCDDPQAIVDCFQPEFEKLLLLSMMLPWGESSS